MYLAAPRRGVFVSPRASSNYSNQHSGGAFAYGIIESRRAAGHSVQFSSSSPHAYIHVYKNLSKSAFQTLDWPSRVRANAHQLNHLALN